MSDLPNLLIISQVIPQSVNAGSIVLQRLLKDYPAEKLLVLGPPAARGASLLGCEYQTIKLPLERLHFTRLARLARSLRVFGLMPKTSAGSIRRRVEQFQPDVVLALVQEQGYFELAYRYAKTMGLPLVLIIHDLPEMFEQVYGWALKRQQAKNGEIYRYAARRLAVSPEMAAHLEKVYSTRSDVLYPNRSAEITPRPAEESRTLKEPGTLTLGYAGSVAYGRADQLVRMIPAMREAGAKLRLYSSGSLDCDARDVVTYCGHAPSAEETWARAKSECDALLLPQVWPDDERYQVFYRTSFPCKLIEYLALGMPVLLVGPEYAAAFRWGLRNADAALVVTKEEHGAWVEALTRLKQSAQLREELSRRAIIAAARDFDPVEITKRFNSYLREAASERLRGAAVSLQSCAEAETL